MNRRFNEKEADGICRFFMNYIIQPLCKKWRKVM